MRCKRRAEWLFIAGALVAGCANPAQRSVAGPPSASPSSSASVVPIHVQMQSGGGREVTIVESVRGRKVYTIRAQSGEMQQSGTNRGSGDFVRPHVTFVARNGTRTFADAPRARISEADKSVVMTGGVRARTSTGSVLTCDTLRYDGNTERLHGSGNVRLTAPNGPGGDLVEVDGDRLDGDVRLQDVKITRNHG
ncbi:MAG: LPS export ABC transporter periplasmic protein LptC [Candidatus Eremiobacteraeota bacterium]|nr:LPS export ABC transporter periplasmic protein LptC [Candidatus Eremiobacteraeota bacterium]